MEKQTDKELEATLDMWKNMEGSQRLEQLKYLLKESQKGMIKIEDVNKMIDLTNPPIDLQTCCFKNIFAYKSELKQSLKELGDK